MRLAIIGSRDFNDYDLLDKTINNHFYDYSHEELMFDEIISGAAAGADSLGAKFAKDNNIKLTEFPAQWEKYGKRAGFLRNEDIILNSDFVLAFWDGLSKGTANSLSIAKRLKKPTMIVYF